MLWRISCQEGIGNNLEGAQTVGEQHCGVLREEMITVELEEESALLKPQRGPVSLGLPALLHTVSHRPVPTPPWSCSS